MKIKIEDLGTSYRIYRMNEVRAMQWPSGRDLEISAENINLLLKENQVKELEDGEFIFQIGGNRLLWFFQTFEQDPELIATGNVAAAVAEATAAAEKEKELSAAAADTNKVVDGATLTPKF